MPEAPATPPGVAAERSIKFKTTPSRDLYLDLYTPDDSARPLPTIVFIYGGAWRAGDRHQVAGPLGALPATARGYAVATLDYRLSHEALFPAQIQDVMDGIRWLREHAEDRGLDPDRFATWGPSAGGHLAALVGAAAHVAGFGSNAHVQAAVDYFGPTDFLQMDANAFGDELAHDAADSPESMLVGGPIQERAEAAADANPITHLSPDVPPFFIVHGDADPLVPYHQSVLLDEALTRIGADVTFVTVEGGGHGRGGTFGTPELFAQTMDFLDRTLGR